MRTMYDAVNALNIPDPLNVAMVAGYVTGDTTWSAADWARFPHAVKVRIDALGSAPLASDVLDVEPGNLGIRAVPPDATAAEVEQMWADLCARAKAWVEVRHAHKLGSTCYIEASRKNQLALELSGLPCVYWMADWDIPESVADSLIRGAEVAIQYKSTPGYDVSKVHDNWFPAAAVQVAPPPSHVPPALVSVKMIATYSDKTTKEIDL